jgi:molybdopterin-containing oxidoreductase family membrane subunit
MRILGVELRFNELKNAGLRYWCFVLALLIIIGVGVYSYYLQLKYGLIITGMRDIFTWGFYIQNFWLFVGLAAGGLIIYSGVNLFGAKQFMPTNKIAVLQAAVCVLLAMLFIPIDLGNPQRVYYFLLTPNFDSIFVFDAAVLNLYFILCIIDLFVLLSGRATHNLELGLTIVSLPTAIGIHSITAWTIGLAKAREMWHTALMAPIFISSAVASGLALLIIMLLIIRKYTDEYKFEDEMFHSAGKLLATVLLVDLFFLLSEILTTYWPYSETPGHSMRLEILTSGRYSPFFLSEIFIFGILPFLLLWYPKTRKNITVLTVSSIFVLIGVFLKRFAFLGLGFGINPLGHTGVYVPTLPELAITMAVWAIGILIVTISIKLFDMKTEPH